MKNVYDLVRSFYDKEEEWHASVSRDWIEGFLRQKAWQGASDNELKVVWRQLELFTLYLMYIDNTDLTKIRQEEYQRAVEWLNRHVTGFTASPRALRRFFGTLKEFFDFLAARKVNVNIAELNEAEKYLAEKQKSGRMTRSRIAAGDNRLSSAELARLIRDHGADLEADIGKVIGETAERLMTKLGVFFQHERFTEDLRRALFLYSGPADTVIEEEDEEFWLGFWDYFLFDYHLLSSDQTPLSYFDSDCGSSLTTEERLLLTQLLAARFTVFYVGKITGQDWVECVNLFTDETFQLPMPDFGYKSLKQSLFYGHIFTQDIVMVNYVTSVEVSVNLRRRIKEQIVKQKKIFEVQSPNATWQDFFDRHALGVRHAIDRMLHLATLNVTPFALLEKEYPRIENRRIPDKKVVSIIAKVMKEYGFSSHDTKLTIKIWEDFSQLASVKVRKPEVWAAAVIFTYAQINFPRGLSGGQLAADLKVSGKSIYSNRKRLWKVLQLSTFDPRYLSEEGMVCALFLS